MSIRRPTGSGRRGGSARGVTNSGGGIEAPANLNAPTLSASDLTQSSGSYIATDNVQFTAVTSDTDGHVTTGVTLYESGVLVGTMLQGPAASWKYTVSAITAGPKSYVARRTVSGGTKDSAALPITVLTSMAPTDITSATLIAWFRSSESIQMGGTLLPGGTTPPAVTVSSSGVLTSRTEGLFVDIIVGGARGTATFTVYIDNGTTPVASNVTTAATYNIPGTDLILNFPVGTYNADNTYTAICSQWCDKVSSFPTSTNNYVNAAGGAPFTTTSRPKIRAASASTLGAPCIRFDGTDDLLESTGTLGTATWGGADTPVCSFMLIELLTMPAGGTIGTIHSASNITDTDLPYINFEFVGTGPAYHTVRRGDTGTVKGTSANIIPAIGVKLIEDTFDGTNRTISINTADVIGGDSGVATAESGLTVTTTKANLGARRLQSGTTNYANYDLYEQVVFNGPLSAIEKARLRAYFME